MRITQLTATTELEQTDYLAVDDETVGTRKILPEDMLGSFLEDKYVSYGIDTVTTEAQANARYNLGIGLATTENEGLVQLYNGVDSTSITKAATAAAVKLAYEHGGGGGSGPITVYTSVTDLSLTVGSATISGIWSAMASESMLLCEVTNLASGERPFSSAAGTLQVYKKGSISGFIEVHGRKTADGDYRMFLSDNGVPNGTWVNTALSVAYKDFTASVNLNANGYTYVPIDVTVPTGYSLVNLVLKTGTTVQLRNSVAMFVTCWDNHNGFMFYNRENTAQSGTVTLRAFYVLTDNTIDLT